MDVEGGCGTDVNLYMETWRSKVIRYGNTVFFHTQPRASPYMDVEAVIGAIAYALSMQELQSQSQHTDTATASHTRSHRAHVLIYINFFLQENMIKCR